MNVICDNCDGSGIHTERESCQKCDGIGVICSECDYPAGPYGEQCDCLAETWNRTKAVR